MLNDVVDGDVRQAALLRARREVSYPGMRVRLPTPLRACVAFFHPYRSL